MKQAKVEQPPPEFKAFEEFTRKLLAVSKEELDRRLHVEQRKKKRGRTVGRTRARSDSA